MKKIVTVSLVAMMAVSAAHADLASTAYVEGKVGDHAAVIAGADTLGHVKIGKGIAVDGTGVISVSAEGMIGAGEITTGMIADSAITNGKLAADAVTSEKIKNGEVKTDDVADNAITTAKILDGEVKTADIAGDAVTSEKIKDGEVKTDDIANLAVTTAKIADSAVTSGKILDGTIAIADLNSEVTDLMNGHQLVSNIQTNTNHNLSEQDQNIKYTSVSYVDAKVATATQNLPTLGQDVNALKNEVVEMKKTDSALETAVGVNAADIGLTKNDQGAVTSFTGTSYLTDETTLTGAAVALDKEINDLYNNKQDNLSESNVTSTGNGVVKTVVADDGTLEFRKAQVVETDIADKAVTKAKLSTDVQTSLGLADGSLQKSTLENEAIRKAANQGDGEYALTMKVVDGVIAYQWDKISY